MRTEHGSRSSGFTLLEIIIVVAIIAILSGIAVPYYTEYIQEARANAMKSSLANIRRVINEFTGTHGRGPFRGTVWLNSPGPAQSYDCTFSSPTNNELASGPVPTVANFQAGNKTRRHNLRYMNLVPAQLEDQYGVYCNIVIASASLMYAQGGPHANEFDYDVDAYFEDSNLNGQWDGPVGVPPVPIDNIKSGTAGSFGGVIFPADVTDIKLIDSAGNTW